MELSYSGGKYIGEFPWKVTEYCRWFYIAIELKYRVNTLDLWKPKKKYALRTRSLHSGIRSALDRAAFLFIEVAAFDCLYNRHCKGVKWDIFL